MHKMPAARAVEREFTEYFKASVDDVVELRLSSLPGAERGAYKRRLKQLHPSSFPYCGYKHAYESLVREADPVVYQQFGDDYYLGVGSLAHSILQHWLGRRGQMLGNWRCDACERLYEMQVRPKRCKTCKARNFRYEEVGGVWGKYIWWHKDGIFQDRKGRLWIVDYKTTSTSALWQHQKTGTKFPYINNRLQAESYVVLAEEKYQRPIAGWILFYASRDYPTYGHKAVASVMSDERKDEVRARLKADDRTFKIVLGLKDNPQHIGRLRQRKLCPDRTFYKENVHDRYRPCPVHKQCFNAEKSRLVFESAFKGIPIVEKE